MKDSRYSWRRYPKIKKKNLTQKMSLQCFMIFRNLYVYLLLDFLHEMTRFQVRVISMYIRSLWEQDTVAQCWLSLFLNWLIASASPSSERLKQLKLYPVQGCILRTDLVHYWQIFHGQSSNDANVFFFRLLSCISKRGHCLKLQIPMALTEIYQRSFSNCQATL